jgi:hypothetical protein
MIPSSISSKRLADWTVKDLEMVVNSSAEESIGLELKERLPLKKDARGWEQNRQIHSSERDGLAKEIVALANSYGGHLIIGIEETEDHPKRAKALANPISDIHTLADRLRDSLLATIDPPILGLDLKAIEVTRTANTPHGFIVIHVPNSSTAPHGFGTPTQAYVRRGDKSMPMTMRDMQNRFFEAATSREKIDREFDRFALKGSDVDSIPVNCVGASLTIVPTFPVAIDSVAAVLEDRSLKGLSPKYQSTATASFASSPFNANWRPTAFGAEYALKPEHREGAERNWRWTVDEQGTINVAGMRRGSRTSPIQEASKKGVYDVEVAPLWFLVAVRDLISLKHALHSFLSWPDIPWLFCAQLWAPVASTWVCTDRSFAEYERCDLEKPVRTRPLPFSSPYEKFAMQRIENKINNSFNLADSEFGSVLDFYDDDSRGVI